MRAILEKYGLALFVLVVVGIMIAMGPILGNTMSNNLQNEVTESLTKGYILVNGSEFKSTIPSTATDVVFTDEKAPDGVTVTDVSAAKDGKIVSWLDGTTYKVSTQRAGKIIFGNADCSSMFSSKSNLVSINFKNFYTSNVTNMESMFNWCKGLTTLDVSNFDTSKVKNMRVMFNNCTNLTSLDLGDKFDTSNVTDMYSMFRTCEKLIIDCSSWNVSNVTNYDGFNIYASSKIIPPTWP